MRSFAHSLRLADGEDGVVGGIDWVSLLTPTTLAVLGGLLLILLTLLSVAAYLVYRKVRRSPLLRDRALALRAQVLPEGGARTVAELRVRLRQAMSGAEAAVGRASAQGRDAGSLPQLVTRLRWLVDELDVDLTLLSREHDGQRLRAVLPGARQRVEAVEAAAARVRTAALSGARSVHDQELRTLSAEIHAEVEREQAWVQAYRELGGGRV